MMYGNHMGAGGWLFSIFATLVILGLIGMTIIWATRSRPDRRSDPSTSAPSARELLDRRMVSGEITTDQYDQLRGRLDDPRSVSSGDGPLVDAADTRD